MAAGWGLRGSLPSSLDFMSDRSAGFTWIFVGLGIQHCVGRGRIFVGLDASHLAVSAGVGSLLDLLSNTVLGGVGFSVDLMILHWLCSEVSDLRWTLCYVH